MLADLPTHERTIWTQLLFEATGAQRVQKVFTDAKQLAPLIIKVSFVGLNSVLRHSVATAHSACVAFVRRLAVAQAAS